MKAAVPSPAKSTNLTSMKEVLLYSWHTYVSHPKADDDDSEDLSFENLRKHNSVSWFLQERHNDTTQHSNSNHKQTTITTYSRNK